jgi:flavin reductase (DIM6/NTAB) family NADH-FMN oxidoreductase RutF
MKTISIDEIALMEQRHRATFINSLWGFRNLSLIGTTSENQKINFSIFNSFNHLGANPCLASITFRPPEVERHTYQNIVSQKFFSVNNVTKEFYKAAHQTSARYSIDVNEAEAAELETCFDNEYNIPYIGESNLVLVMKYEQHIDLRINNTVLLIASLQKVLLKIDCIEEDGFVNHNKAKSLNCAGLDAYYEPSLIARLPYAKP